MLRHRKQSPKIWCLCMLDISINWKASEISLRIKVPGTLSCSSSIPILFGISISDQKTPYQRKHIRPQSPPWNLIICFRKEEWRMQRFLDELFHKIMPYFWAHSNSRRIIFKLTSVSLAHSFSITTISCPSKELSTLPIFSFPYEKGIEISIPLWGFEVITLWCDPPIHINTFVWYFPVNLPFVNWFSVKLLRVKGKFSLCP